MAFVFQAFGTALEDAIDSKLTKGEPTRDSTTGGITSSIEDDFVFEKTLGTGGFAVVKEAKHKHSGKKYAVKIMSIAGEGGDDEEEDGMSLKEIADEIKLTMMFSKEEHIVRVYDFYQSADHVYVIMELLKGGELLEAVLEHGEYTEKQTAAIMKQLFQGLESVHQHNISHRDLKLENLILAEQSNLESLRIADFGLAKKMKTARGKLTAQCGTPSYVAPEVLTGEKYTPAVDMWASGIIMYTLMMGEFPFYDDDEQKMFRLIAKGDVPQLPNEFSDVCKDLCNKLLTRDPVKRLTASEALEHPWIVSGGKNVKGEVGGAINRSRMAKFVEKRLGAELELRSLKPGDVLIQQGERAKHVYLIKEGSCEVLVKNDQGEEVKVAERHAGEFIGEMGVKTKADGVADAEEEEAEEEATKEKSGGSGGTADAAVNVMALLRVKNSWLGGRRKATVKATTDMKVLVMSSAQMQWVLDNDYGTDGEVANTIAQRKEELSRSGSNAK